MQKKLLKKLNRNLGTLINDVGCYPLDFKPYRLMSASKLFPYAVTVGRTLVFKI